MQALVSPTSAPSPRRTANGVDYNRMCLLLAVLEKRLGLKFSQCDVYMNVIGGLRIDDPGADAAIALALISGLRDIVIPQANSARSSPPPSAPPKRDGWASRRSLCRSGALTIG